MKKRKNEIQAILVILLSTLLLMACGNHSHVKKVLRYINELKNQPVKENVNVVSLLQTPKPVTYKAAHNRSPFAQTENIGNGTIKGLNPLQDYPINMLRFVGTLTQNNIIYGYIKTPDDRIYQVKIGDTIGNHYGKIASISVRQMEINEQSNDSSNPAMTEKVTLQLKDSNE